MTDNVNHPSHYADGWSNGAEVIDITENLNFNRGNAVKYIARAGAKDPSKELEDLQKAQWYLSREINRLAPLQVIDDEVVEAREWNSIYDIPNDVRFVDKDGDKRWFIESQRRTNWSWLNDAAPFTEVFE